MCGIVGYVGKKNAREIIISGLEKLEYRGYDSAGVALLDKNNGLVIEKEKGRVEKVKSLVGDKIVSHLGIGHTRWATHGEPNFNNSHPHTSSNGRYVLVHNGVIDNYKMLKEKHLSNVEFKSETDTEVIVNLIEKYSKSNTTERAIRKTLSLLEGSYALVIIDKEDYSKLYVVKNKTPMVIGFANDGVTIASDIMALIGYCDSCVHLEDKSFGIIYENKLKLYDTLGDIINFIPIPLNLSDEDIGKGDYEHYMLKEIEEQPSVVRNLISKYFDDEKIQIDQVIIDKIKSADKINLVACGTSMNACYMAKYYLEKLCNIPAEVFCASELVYSSALLTDKPFFIFLSQSGETADSITVMKQCKKRDFPMLAITNSSKESSMVRLATFHLPIYAGKEIAVASTKAYVAQIITCAILAKKLSGKKTNLRSNLNKVALAMEKIIADKTLIKNIADEIYNQDHAFFIGRGIDYWVCKEASLKLKEISYIHSESYPSGELKHGPIALITSGTPVIAICTQEGSNMATRSNLEETKARGAKTIVISNETLSTDSDDYILPSTSHYLSPLVSVMVTQYLAYYITIKRELDVDKPRNLAKSVTVE